VQLIDQIKHKIAAGALKPGDQLPTVRQLAADLRVNFNTIARAYRMLDEEGIISTQHGRGTFILEPQSEEASEALRRKGLERLTQYYLVETHRLSYAPDEVQQAFQDKLQQWIDEGEPQQPDGEN
jgi:GntR family transcriptional regulator